MSVDEADRLTPFPSTNWSLVGRAGAGGSDAQRKALGALLQRYLPALRAYLLVTKRIPRDRVEDLLQGFILDKIVEQNLIAYAEQRKGKFRSYLLVALNRYLIDEARRDGALKRSPGQGNLVNLADQGEPVSADIGWARQLIAEAAQRMQAECQSRGRQDLWQLFKGRVLAAHSTEAESAPSSQLTQAMPPPTPSEAANLLITAKRMFTRNLRSVIAEYVEDEQMVDEELCDLKRALSEAGA
jgi:RNA polymerase sigma-70 factor (ECF subfamily)